MNTKISLIVIGRFKDEWHHLSPAQQSDFVARVASATATLGLEPITGYRLTSTPGAFMQIWETHQRESIDRAVKNLETLGYTNYIDARWMIGERESPQE